MVFIWLILRLIWASSCVYIYPFLRLTALIHHTPYHAPIKTVWKEKSSEEEVETEIGEVLDVSDVPEISEIPRCN